jgi:hypothetical protein
MKKLVALALFVGLGLIFSAGCSTHTPPPRTDPPAPLGAEKDKATPPAKPGETKPGTQPAGS